MKNTQANLVVSELEKMSAIAIVEDERVQSKFIQLFNHIHGTQSGELIYHKEKFNFLKQLQENPALQQCTKLSLYGAFLDAAVNGLSLETGNKPQSYLIPRPINVGTKNEPRYEKRVSLTVSPYGELIMRMRAGQIKHADDPVIVYEGDIFEIEMNETGKKIIYKPVIPRKSNQIIAGFIRIIKPDDSIDFFWLLKDDIQRLKGYSEKQNKGKANQLYTSNDGQIDTGFLAAKIIKHAFSSYPKVRTGEFTKLQTQEIEEKSIDYGINIPPHTEDGEIIDAESEQIDNEETF